MLVSSGIKFEEDTTKKLGGVGHVLHSQGDGPGHVVLGDTSVSFFERNIRNVSQKKNV